MSDDTVGSKGIALGDGTTAESVAEWNTDTRKAIGGVPVLPPPSTPIADALLALRDAGGLSAADCGALGGLPGVRTLGDLVAVLGRGEIEGKLAAKLRKVLGNAE